MHPFVLAFHQWTLGCLMARCHYRTASMILLLDTDLAVASQRLATLGILILWKFDWLIDFTTVLAEWLMRLRIIMIAGSHSMNAFLLGKFYHGVRMSDKYSCLQSVPFCTLLNQSVQVLLRHLIFRPTVFSGQHIFAIKTNRRWPTLCK